MNSQALVEFFNKMILDFSNNIDNAAYWNAKFDHFARLFGRLSGRSFAFNVAIGVILVWLISGPIFGFSDTWQLIINMATTITTFLMVFLIQHTQNRDTEAMQVKLDELIRALGGANNALLDLEELEEEDFSMLRRRYRALAKEAGEAKKEREKPELFSDD